MYKVYVIKNKGLTLKASEAMAAHRDGETVIVDTRNLEASGFDRLVKSVTIPGASQPRKIDENWKHCRHIAETLEAYADGQVYRCPECGEEIQLPDDVGDKYRCPRCETIHYVDDMEQLGVWDYMSDVYDIEYTVGSDMTFRGVRVMVACGGPNIYINTKTGDVELYWWTESARYAISRDALNAVEEWGEELYKCR